MLQRPTELSISRRRFLALGAAAGVGAVASACSDPPTGGPRSTNNGRLAARAGTPTGSITPGLHELGLSTVRDGLLYVPAGYSPDTPAPLALALHGAGRRATNGISILQPYADQHGLVLLAPDSRGDTWDAVYGYFGEDITFIDEALAKVFATVAIDPARVFVEGFSDGASYALTLGLTNGDLFRKVVAFSAGFVAVGTLHGKPEVFVSHGTQDAILPIDQTSRVFVPQLRNAGYTVDYREFDGGHGVPLAIADAAIAWLLPPPAR